MKTNDDLDPMLRRMFEDHPAPTAPADLARRARRLAAGHARAELRRIEQLRRSMSALTAVVFVAIGGFALHVAPGEWSVSTIISWARSNASPGSSFTTAAQLLIVTAAAAILAVVGAMLLLPPTPEQTGPL